MGEDAKDERVHLYLSHQVALEGFVRARLGTNFLKR